MFASDERNIAASMIRFWEQDAAKVAFGYAKEHEKAGKKKLALSWYTITRLILEFRQANTDSTLQAHG